MKTELIRIWESPTLTPEVEVFIDQPTEETSSYLAQEFNLWKNLFHTQIESCRDFLEVEGCKLAEALVQNAIEARLSLPDQIVAPIATIKNEGSQVLLVPLALKEHKVGGLVKRLARKNLTVVLNRKLEELESNVDPSVAVAAGLVRYATATHLVHRILPKGNRVIYLTASGDEIPTIPVISNNEHSPTVNISDNGILETDTGYGIGNNSDLQETYAPAAHLFFLPKWVSFDDQDRLLVNSLHEAEVSLNSMHRFLRVLHIAISLAPYLVADPEYQEKRYGILGQYVNQGRAMARYEMKETIQVIQQRAKANDLSRGLSLNITYFDDQCLELKIRRIGIIPAGKVIFHPAFVVLAARKERAKVAQDLRLNYSTRKHLQVELTDLERAFDTFKNQSKSR